MSLATIIPVEIVNHILSFRPRHPVAKLINPLAIIINNYKNEATNKFIETFYEPGEDEWYEEQGIKNATFYELYTVSGEGFNRCNYNQQVLYDYRILYYRYGVYLDEFLN
jgi:hypothetical protein